MQYLMSVIHDQAGLATPDEHAAIDVFEAPGLDVALRLAAEGSEARNRKIEVRSFL